MPGGPSADCEVLPAQRERDPGSDRYLVPRHDHLGAPGIAFRNIVHYGRIPAEASVTCGFAEGWTGWCAPPTRRTHPVTGRRYDPVGSPDAVSGAVGGTSVQPGSPLAFR